MSQFSDQRTSLRDLLASAGLNAFTTVPEAFTPPGVFAGPDDPYLDFDGAAFGCVLVHNQLTLVAAAGTNNVRADELDDLILQVLTLFRPEPDGFQVASVDQPGRINLNGQTFLAVAIHMTPVEIVLPTGDEP